METFLGLLSHGLADIVDTEELMNTIYPNARVNENTAKLVNMFSRKLKISRHSTVLNLNALPRKVYARPDYHPVLWGAQLFRESIPDKLAAHIGGVITTYNISSHNDVLPSISGRLVAELGIEAKSIPLDMPHLGCAGGLIAMERARQVAIATQKAVFVYVFDHCSWALNQNFDRSNVHFKKSLIANSLFSDAAVSFIVFTECLVDKVAGPKMQLLEQKTFFTPGKEIAMAGGVFLVGDGLARDIPGLVVNRLLQPLLEEAGVGKQGIHEWSMHQGGKAVLEAFTRLDGGLTPEQIETSMRTFWEYGNLSAPSCFMVLKKYFQYQQKPGADKSRGIIISFGAGYYVSACLYQWI